MLNRKKKKKKAFSGQTTLKSLKYSPKILVAWGEAISGNTAIRDLFMSSDEYEELGIFVHALKLQDDARDWLVENGFAHLMALVNGAEGNADAIRWLNQNNLDVLKNVALSGDGDDNAHKWLLSLGHIEFAMISLKIRKMKDDIEEENNDMHRISRE